MNDPSVPLGNIRITGGEDGYSRPLAIADDNWLVERRRSAPGVVRSVLESFTRAADLNLLPHLDLRPERIELESARPAMVVIAQGVERELMRKIK